MASGIVSGFSSLPQRAAFGFVLLLLSGFPGLVPPASATIESSPPFLITDKGGSPVAASDRRGRFLLVWGDTRLGLVGQRFNAAGARVGGGRRAAHRLGGAVERGEGAVLPGAVRPRPGYPARAR